MKIKEKNRKKNRWGNRRERKENSSVVDNCCHDVAGPARKKRHVGKGRGGK